jgi:hypothetical protein
VLVNKVLPTKTIDFNQIFKQTTTTSKQQAKQQSTNNHSKPQEINSLQRESFYNFVCLFNFIENGYGYGIVNIFKRYVGDIEFCVSELRGY